MEKSKLEQGDFYFNAQGLMVFTAKYHLRRGYCCKSGCKHCPYGYRKNAVDTDSSVAKNEASGSEIRK